MNRRHVMSCITAAIAAIVRYVGVGADQAPFEVNHFSHRPGANDPDCLCRSGVGAFRRGRRESAKTLSVQRSMRSTRSNQPDQVSNLNW